MALKLIANYSKRLGLPGYSSHQFSVCVETELSNINDVAGESSRLYQSLQQSVDEEIQHTGFVPDEGYGKPQAVRAAARLRHAANTRTEVAERIDLLHLLRIILPVAGILLVLLAAVTLLSSLGPALLPIGIIASLGIAAWLWLPRK